jgi:CDP-4-dehydro-6-deoxyglucose reductase, E1
MTSKYQHTNMPVKYPLAKETINKDDIDALIDWLKTYPRLTKWKLTEEFEKKWAEWIGTKYAVNVNSGSSANLLMFYSLIVLDKLKSKKVIVPSIGWATTISPVIQFGLEPIMVDADPITFGIDLDETENLLKTNEIGAIIFVQQLGIPHQRDRLLELCKTYDVPLLEDACASLGSSYEDGTKVGQIGDMSSFSFYFGHQLSTIEGGMINTDDEELYHTLLMLRSHGWGKDLPKGLYKQKMIENNIDIFHEPFTFLVPGFNVRSTDLQAFLGCRQVDKADWMSHRRYENHLLYTKLLGNSFEHQLYGNDKPASISFALLAENGEHRKEIVNRLIENGIETRIFSAGNLGLHPFWKERYGEFHGKTADKIHSCGFYLPNYPELTDDDINFISGVVKNV